jgi:hypothetical protein
MIITTFNILKHHHHHHHCQAQLGFTIGGHFEGPITLELDMMPSHEVRLFHHIMSPGVQHVLW